IESTNLGDAHAIWSANDGVFAFSWKYQGAAWLTKVQKYRPNGTSAGNNVGMVPTNTGSNYEPGSEDDCQLASSGAYYGVAFQPNSGGPPCGTNTACLTVLDDSGLQVGSSFVPLSANMGIDNWLGVGGTGRGFIAMYTSGGSIDGSFVPLAGAGDVLVDGGIGQVGVDGGLPPLKTFSFSSTASTGKIISDAPDGAGGVGTVLLENDGAAFVYVTADGSKVYNEGAVISDGAATEVGVSNYHGSFVVSLFDGTTHAAQASVSICP
ncbi:MAG TPA: hypothetical protein VHO06_05245, partial [Polyangia bacterium]|nr:hypothetical protein [Polyangia bacterium]